MAKPPLTFRRLSGLDRSGAPPPETQAGQPLRPWTIPNFIGYARLALVPVFLVLALSSDTGTDPLPAVLFAVAVWGDYADGIAARVTGQYSRLGTLLDPIVDRLIILAGVVVCWRFELLPRWAIAVLAGRELFMLLAGQYAVRHGVELKINWPGRWSVWPLMSAIFLALCGVEDVAAVLLYVGLALALWATVLYGVSAVRQLREPSRST
ncbi:CDP-alcohol phosphatidyltransferase family protein [Capillimicrobium parvum]|uniref:Cardiolipin synthase n=1 Tax=Capillimicrobium parvum TaxID=2884022 RepID=A0A9E6XXT5_9ACTN|nr:CDP-alcohol phosphatidyltransferase family protein [Capillimicrobium parvum]UGS36333.1 Putative cardiolipin synthase [Capillimicrobium parvum]